MLEEALAQLNLERYLEVTKRLLGQSVTLIVVSEQHDRIHIGPKPPPVTDWLDAQTPQWQQTQQAQHRQAHGHEVLIFPLCDHHDTPVAQLLVVYPVSDQSILDSAIALLNPLVECIQTELRLADELMAMADELTSRYEELNLVYDTQDQASDYEETQNQLKQLVDNCLEYLNVEFATLILRDKQLTLRSATSDIDTSDFVLAVEELQGQLYDWVCATKQVVVINGIKDKLAAVLCAGVPYKIVATPVIQGSGGVSGVLIIGRTYSQNDFTNNDKNLLDVMARKASKLVQATYDSNTGLIKRSGFEFYVRWALQSAKVAGESHAVFIIDIDRMQVINDTLGYDAGDMVIDRLATVFTDLVRSGDTVARVSGDEFGVVLPNCELGEAKKVALKFVAAVEAMALTWNNTTIDVNVSIGVSPVTADHANVDAVIAAAEVACSSVKDRGGNGVSLYRSGDEELVRRRSYMDLVGRIQDTLRSDRFELYCQPIAPLQPSEHGVHGEVLLRMLDEAGEVIAPGLFLPAAERYHLMPAIDRWVIGKTLSMIEASKLLEQHAAAMVCINLSGQTLSDEAFLRYLHSVLDETSVPTRNICLEITETTAISDIARVQRFIAALKERGVSFALDDFGTGLSSFSYLQMLPVDYLKIDGSFVKDICTDPVAKTMVEAINKVGHTMNLKTIGEFVENDEILEALAEIGVDYGQGYGIAKPKPFSEYLAALSTAETVRKIG